MVEIFLSARDKHDSPVCMVYTEHRILLNFQLIHILDHETRLDQLCKRRTVIDYKLLNEPG